MPSEKRARQRAGKQARMAELQRAQSRSRRNRQLTIVGVVVVVFIALGLWVGISGSSKKTKVSSSTSTTSPGTTLPVGPSTASATAASLAGLTTRTAPAVSSSCGAKVTPTGATTTIPAKSPAVAVIGAPAGVGFPNLDGSAPHYTSFKAAPPFCIDTSKTYTATMTTDLGKIVIKLYPQYAPVTVNNFVFLAGYHYFDGTIFHRVIPGFVDQGGDPTGTGSGSPGYSIPDELPKTPAAYDDGAVAMANAGANTGGSQFFLVVGNGGQQLSAAYSDFGQIVSGLDVAKKINNDGDSSDNGSPPKVTHKLLKVTISES